ncbi:MAG: peptide chain release factor N(5)-glutamine methyltransferase [Pseudomonadota bacterium]
MSDTTRAALIRAGAARLGAAGIEDAAREARLLCRWAGGLSGAGLAARLDEPASADEQARLAEALERRTVRVPLSHITGERAFFGHSFRVTPAVLDPRPETETVVHACLERPATRILDLGTGSGCILLSLLGAWPKATGLGTDIDAAALAIARENAVRLGVGQRAAFAEGNWFDAVAGGFDLVVSNPPYIAEADIAHLAPEVREHEPRHALTPGGDGLSAYRALARGIPAHLNAGGRAIVEVGAGQAEAVMALLRQAGFSTIETRADLDGRARALIAQDFCPLRP